MYGEKKLDKKLPNWVAPRINHTEANLHPFYVHLEEVHDRLSPRSELVRTLAHHRSCIAKPRRLPLRRSAEIE